MSKPLPQPPRFSHGVKATLLHGEHSLCSEKLHGCRGIIQICIVVECHNSPSIISRITTWSTPVNTTLSGVRSIAVPCWSTVLIRLKEIIQSVCTESNAELLELEVMPEHVHLLVEVDPQYGIHRLVRAIKGRSSRLLRQEYPWLRSRLPTLWTNAYFVSTVGSAPLEVIKQYIEQQKRL